MIGGLAHAFVAVSTHEPGQLTSHDYSEASSNEFLQRAIEEVTRYINADRLVPSYHNAITVAGIEVYLLPLSSGDNRIKELTRFFSVISGQSS